MKSALTHWKTTLAGLASGLATFLAQPDIHHAAVGLGMAILGALAGDAKKAE